MAGRRTPPPRLERRSQRLRQCPVLRLKSKCAQAPGCPRVLESSISSAASPRSNRNPQAGTGNNVGRFKAEPRALVNSRFRTAALTKFTGPSALSFVIKKSTARTVSANPIHGIHCCPEPSRPPKPNRNGNRIAAKAPPPAPSTIPNRKCTTRTPTSCTGRVAASHSPHSSAKNPAPCGTDSSTTVSPQSP